MNLKGINNAKIARNYAATVARYALSKSPRLAASAMARITGQKVDSGHLVEELGRLAISGSTAARELLIADGRLSGLRQEAIACFCKFLGSDKRVLEEGRTTTYYFYPERARAQEILITMLQDEKLAPIGG